MNMFAIAAGHEPEPSVPPIPEPTEAEPARPEEIEPTPPTLRSG